jgi:dCTP deaminase
MAFWSSQRLERELKRIVGHQDRGVVDCNAITMRVGGEVYITPGLDQAAPNSHTKQILGPSEPIAIPPGQFAFLLTEEVVTIPPEVMGFISIRATFKSKGLVNVSGFHVDPGWKGTLIFAVFNAGPATVHLQRGMPLFLLWIADLDEASAKRKTTPGPTGIPPAMINNITGVVDSVYALEKRMKEEFKALRDKNDEFRKEVAEVKERQTRALTYLGIAAVIGGALVGAGVKAVSDHFFPAAPAASSLPPAGGTGAIAPSDSRPAVAPQAPAARPPAPVNPKGG